MHEIFRAKRIFDNKWEYGGDDHFYWFENNLYFYNVSDHLDWKREKCKVDYHTFGESIELSDKNGKEIFTDDILCGAYGDKPYRGKVIFKNGLFALEHNSNEYKYDAALDNHANMKIIGNIYDNPELFAYNQNK